VRLLRFFLEGGVLIPVSCDAQNSVNKNGAATKITRLVFGQKQKARCDFIYTDAGGTDGAFDWDRKLELIGSSTPVWHPGPEGGVALPNRMLSGKRDTIEEPLKSHGCPRRECFADPWSFHQLRSVLFVIIFCS